MDLERYDGNDKIKTQLKYIKALSKTEAMGILIELCKENDLMERICAMAKASLSDVDADKVADKVFKSLNSIQIEELWNNSGRTYYGYQEETDVAFDMLNTELYHFIQEMEQYRRLDMKKEEKEYCKGIIAGIFKYGSEGSNEFHEAVPDEPYIIADNILQEWKEYNKSEDIGEVQKLYDSYFSYEESELITGAMIWDSSEPEFMENEIQQKILALMASHPKISAREISEKIIMAHSDVKKNISILKKAGLIEHIGATKGGSWVAKEASS